MIFTKSNDGVRRATLRVRVRLDRSAVDELTTLAAIAGHASLEQFLASCLHDGIAAAKTRKADDDETERRFEERRIARLEEEFGEQ